MFIALHRKLTVMSASSRPPEPPQVSGHALNSIQAVLEAELRYIANSPPEGIDYLFAEAEEVIAQAEAENSDLKQRIEGAEWKLEVEERKNAQWAFDLEQIEFFLAQRPDSWRAAVDGESKEMTRMIAKLREIIDSTNEMR
jgi:hypothetical protein